MPNYLLFDVVGTLIQPVISIATTYHEHGKRYGSKLNEDEIRRRFLSSFRDLFVNRGSSNDDPSVTSELDQKKRWRDLVDSVFRDVGQTDELFQGLWNYYGSAHAWCLYNDVELCWPRFEDLGFVVCLASNFDERLFDIVANMEPLKRAQHVFCSSRLGHEKPGWKFYSAIESQLPTGQFVMVGDDQKNDYDGPTKFGWKAILLDRSDKHNVENSVRSLVNLVRLFEKS